MLSSDTGVSSVAVAVAVAVKACDKKSFGRTEACIAVDQTDERTQKLGRFVCNERVRWAGQVDHNTFQYCSSILICGARTGEVVRSLNKCPISFGGSFVVCRCSRLDFSVRLGESLVWSQTIEGTWVSRLQAHQAAFSTTNEILHVILRTPGYYILYATTVEMICTC